MNKQLVMENYVDECLDEVEIRGLYITEGVMDTPLKNIIQPLLDKVYMIDRKIGDLKSSKKSAEDFLPHYKKWGREALASKSHDMKIHSKTYYKEKSKLNMDIWVKSQKFHNKVIDRKIENIKNQNEIIKNTTDKIKSLEYKKNDLKSLIDQAKNNPGLLGNIPILYTIIGATAIVAAVAYASYKLYKRFMSKAAKACQDKKGKVKTICMNQYQLKGLEASKKPFLQGMKNCSKAKEVQSCKAKFNKKINAIDKKITKKQNQIKKLMGR